MTGQILTYSYRASSGIISGDDGLRYTFPRSEWLASSEPAPGLRVDFVAWENSSQATAVYTTPATVAARPVDDGREFRESKSRVVAGLLALFLGGLGIHKFYLGYSGPGLILLITSILGVALTLVLIGWAILIVVGIVCLIETVIYLTKSDAEFHTTYVTGKKPWF